MPQRSGLLPCLTAC